jgi:hypothetical protein
MTGVGRERSVSYWRKLLQFQWIVWSLTRKRQQRIATVTNGTREVKPRVVHIRLRDLQGHQHLTTVAYPHGDLRT